MILWPQFSYSTHCIFPNIFELQFLGQKQFPIMRFCVIKSFFLYLPHLIVKLMQGALLSHLSADICKLVNIERVDTKFRAIARI
jgi:hypothetical protein